MFLGEMNYVRGCINQIEAVRPEMPTVRENGCWTATENYIVCALSVNAERGMTTLCLGFGISTVVRANRRADLLLL